MKKRRRRQYLKKRDKRRLRQAIQASIDRAEKLLLGEPSRLERLWKAAGFLAMPIAAGDTFSFETQVTISET
jgi:hypothetical protein